MAKGMNDWFLIFALIFAALTCFILLVYVVRKHFQGGWYKNKDVRLEGRVVIITGANSGIGKEAAVNLARRGAKVYMACRDREKMEAARQEILDRSGSHSVFSMDLDLASFDSIRKFVKTFRATERRLHILINNAGVMACSYLLTTDGFEMHLGTNHLGHFLLTNLLQEMLKKSVPSRVITIASKRHSTAVINKDDLNSDKDYKPWTAYKQSKLCNILFSKHLAKKLEGTGVTTYAIHPGEINTHLTRHINKFLMFIARPILYVFFKSPKSGAQTTIYCACEPSLSKESGKYYSDCKEVEPSTNAKSDEMAEWLWKISEKLTGYRKTV